MKLITHITLTAQCMDRDDITVVLKGLTANLDRSIWNWNYIKEVHGDLVHASYRVFGNSESNPDIYSERSESTSMKISDYDTYLNLRNSCVKSKKDQMFSYVDGMQVKQTISVLNTVIYLTDFNIEVLLPDLFQDLYKNYALPEILPGGSKCHLRWLTRSSRPGMGPNIYITPPGSYTIFHTDGHGTVDSGRCTLSLRSHVCCSLNGNMKLFYLNQLSHFMKITI